MVIYLLPTGVPVNMERNKTTPRTTSLVVNAGLQPCLRFLRNLLELLRGSSTVRNVSVRGIIRKLTTLRGCAWRNTLNIRGLVWCGKGCSIKAVSLSYRLLRPIWHSSSQSTPPYQRSSSKSHSPTPTGLWCMTAWGSQFADHYHRYLA